MHNEQGTTDEGPLPFYSKGESRATKNESSWMELIAPLGAPEDESNHLKHAHMAPRIGKHRAFFWLNVLTGTLVCGIGVALLVFILRESPLRTAAPLLFILVMV